MQLRFSNRYRQRHRSSTVTRFAVLPQLEYRSTWDPFQYRIPVAQHVITLAWLFWAGQLIWHIEYRS